MKLYPEISEEELLLSSLIPHGDNSPLYQCFEEDEEGKLRPLWKESAEQYFDYEEYCQLLNEFGFNYEI